MRENENNFFGIDGVNMTSLLEMHICRAGLEINVQQLD